MILKEEIEKHLGYCRLQKGLDEKAVRVRVLGSEHPDTKILLTCMDMCHM